MRDLDRRTVTYKRSGMKTFGVLTLAKRITKSDTRRLPLHFTSGSSYPTRKNIHSTDAGARPLRTEGAKSNLSGRPPWLPMHHAPRRQNAPAPWSCGRGGPKEPRMHESTRMSSFQPPRANRFARSLPPSTSLVSAQPLLSHPTPPPPNPDRDPHPHSFSRL